MKGGICVVVMVVLNLMTSGGYLEFQHFSEIEWPSLRHSS